MPNDPYIIDRIEHAFQERRIGFYIKSMFGGDFFMVDDKMCIGVFKNNLMARVGPEEADKLVSRDGASHMTHGGRPMVGYVQVEPIGFDTDDDLNLWVDKSLAFNPLAKASKRKK